MSQDFSYKINKIKDNYVIKWWKAYLQPRRRHLRRPPNQPRRWRQPTNSSQSENSSQESRRELLNITQ